jgi:hypothetical protein
MKYYVTIQSNEKLPKKMSRRLKGGEKAREIIKKDGVEKKRREKEYYSPNR